MFHLQSPIASTDQFLQQARPLRLPIHMVSIHFFRFSQVSNFLEIIWGLFFVCPKSLSMTIYHANNANHLMADIFLILISKSKLYINCSKIMYPVLVNVLKLEAKRVVELISQPCKPQLFIGGIQVNVLLLLCPSHFLKKICCLLPNCTALKQNI